MKIINAMLGKGLGGIEYVSVLFAKALAMRGHEVLMVIRKDADIESTVIDAAQEYKNLSYLKIDSFGDYDLFAKLKARKLINDYQPDAVIARGNRAVRTFKWASKNKSPLIAGTPNYRFKSLIGLPGIIATTEHLKQKIIASGQDESKVWVLPNTLEVKNFEGTTRDRFRNPVVIGSMGRFVHKKGFHVLIDALGKLKEQNINFKCKLGGKGEDEIALKNLVNEYELSDEIEFTGWVTNKAEFFSKIDVFVLPSLHEPFGIILLEAYAAALPVVSSDSEGPIEVGEDNKDCVFYPKNDSKALSEKIKWMINNEIKALALSDNAYKKVKFSYDLPIFAGKLEQIVFNIVERFNKKNN